MTFTVNQKAFILSLIGTGLGVGFIVKYALYSILHFLLHVLSYYSFAYFRDRVSGKKYTYQTDAGRRKVVIITGASTGLGKAAAKDLIFRKAAVVLACRDMEKCEKVCFN